MIAEKKSQEGDGIQVYVLLQACQQQSYSKRCPAPSAFRVRQRERIFQLGSGLGVRAWIRMHMSNLYVQAQAQMFKTGFMQVVDLTRMRKAIADRTCTLVRVLLYLRAS